MVCVMLNVIFLKYGQSYVLYKNENWCIVLPKIFYTYYFFIKVLLNRFTIRKANLPCAA